MNVVKPFSLLTEYDIQLFKSGNHFRLYQKLGAHPVEYDGEHGFYFAVYAPAANKVELIGDFNYWSGDQHQLHVRFDESGIWEGFVPHTQVGQLYKYKITNVDTGEVFEKSDPFAFYCEAPPRTGSILWDISDIINDNQEIKINNSHSDPLSIYEMHLPSWKRPWDHRTYMSYREAGQEIINHVGGLGFTHVELMPIMEYPYDPSWGYQITGYFAPTSRMGTPHDFYSMVKSIRSNGIGVILDWVPSHFPEDKHGLAKFDGSCVFEHPDPQVGFHPDWKSMIFNYGRPEVRSFLISNAFFWVDVFGVDGLRVDAVASMLYLDYSRKEGEWKPNVYGGNENLDAISFLKDLNKAMYKEFPYVQLIAEESTSFDGVTRPVHDGGLGFGYKWMMGWMNDSLSYFKKDPVHRKFHQSDLTFSLVYAFSENFVLPFSHDEVVHGKGSLINKMPGDEWQKFANIRLLYGYMWTHPGAKLLFMGSEFAQHEEWDHDQQLRWDLLQNKANSGVSHLIKDLNHLYRTEPALSVKNYSSEGFQWIDYHDNENSILVFLRTNGECHSDLIVVLNLTPSAHKYYKIGVPHKGQWKEILNTDDLKYGGSSYAVSHEYNTLNENSHGHPHSIVLEVPPLATRVFKLEL